MIPLTTRAGGTCFGFPDVCLVPATPSPVPTPFPNVGECRDADGTVDAILVENKEVVVETSRIPTSTGDEPGSLGGVVSGMTRGAVKFTTASAKVYAKGKRVVLANALTTHNGDNANVPSGSQVAPSQGHVFASG